MRQLKLDLRICIRNKGHGFEFLGEGFWRHNNVAFEFEDKWYK